MPEEAAFRVLGRVQGVGFRGWTRSQARRLGLQGWVRNVADGSVEVVARGSAEALERLRERLGQGPPLARVRLVERLEAPPAVDGTPAEGFHVLRTPESEKRFG